MWSLTMSLQKELQEYVLTRLVRWKVALIWAILVITSHLSACLQASFWTTASLRDAAYVSVMLMALIVALRIWDDLADRDYDAKHHTQRVLPHSRFASVYVAVVVLLFCATLTMMWMYSRAGQVWILCILIAGLILVYGGGYFIKLPRQLRAQCVLLKYPFLLLLFSEVPFSPMSLILAVMVYGLASADELISSFKSNDIESETL
jgi:4-hydroxybenzoate polyprenyltransferase